jgi:hypothetical protein
MAMKTLHIFDFDDTLVKSDARVVITSPDGSVKELSSEEYAKYTPQDGETEDFSDFDSYPKNPEIIEPVFEELLNSIDSDGVSRVVILTARSNPVPVRAFLINNKIPKIHVEAVGSSDPRAKAEYILKRIINDDEIQTVRVFEDNVRNIRTIIKTFVDSNVQLKTNRVKNGRVTKNFGMKR